MSVGGGGGQACLPASSCCTAERHEAVLGCTLCFGGAPGRLGLCSRAQLSFGLPAVQVTALVPCPQQGPHLPCCGPLEPGPLRGDPGWAEGAGLLLIAAVLPASVLHPENKPVLTLLGSPGAEGPVSKAVRPSQLPWPTELGKGAPWRGPEAWQFFRSCALGRLAHKLRHRLSCPSGARGSHHKGLCWSSRSVPQEQQGCVAV